MTLKYLILAISILGSAYSVFLNIVRYRSANNPTPANVADVYDAETYKKWKAYSAEHSRLSIVSDIVSGIVTLALLATNAYTAFASLFPNGEIWQALAVVLLVVAVDAVVDTVISYISTMVIEQKYGFNRSTVKTFVLDRIRSIILSFVLSFGIAMLVRFTYYVADAWMIVIFAAVMFAFTMLVSFLYPIFSRIGNKFAPLEDGELKDKLLALLEKHGYRVKAIEVMDASRRTTKLNAYFTGFGKLKRIVLYDNLVNAMSDDEICAVFAHEMGHGLHKDVLKSQFFNMAYMLIIGAVAWISPIFCEAFGFESLNFGFAFVITGVLLSLFQPLNGLISSYRSRRAEYRADRQAISEGYGETMITALKKLAKDNFSHLSPSRINVVLEYSHPPLDRRIAAIEETIAKQG